MRIGLAALQASIGTKLDQTPSPAGSWLGFTLVSAERGLVAATTVVRPEMCNPYGNIHGGMMALVVDEIIGFAIISLEAEHHYTSVNLDVDFLYAIAEGDVLRAEAQIVRQGKKIINVDVRVYHHQNNTLLAKGSSNLVVTNMKMKAD